MADTEREAGSFFRRPERLDWFTPDARSVLSLAQVEAQRFNHNYLGTEHLLLALARLGENDPAGKLLRRLGVEARQIQNNVEFIVGRGDRPVQSEVGLTPRAKKVIELAVAGAREFGHRYLGTEHLLLGLVDEAEGIAAGALESLGVTPEKVRAEIRIVLSETTQPEFLMDVEARAVLWAWWETFFNDPEVPEALKLEELVRLRETLWETQNRLKPPESASPSPVPDSPQQE